MVNQGTLRLGVDYTFTSEMFNDVQKRYITRGQPQFAGGVVFGTYDAPREWYATFGVRL
jgi:hypothetical protein